MDKAAPQIAHDLNKKVRSLDVVVEGEEAAIDFRGLHLSENVVKGLLNCGFHKPSPIQLRAIPFGRCGFDLLLQAKSGTGKTCVFSVIALEDVSTKDNCIQSVILAPSREIAYQNTNVLKTIGVFKEGLKVRTFIGGTSVAQSVQKMMTCHIAVGTPGRIVQLITEFKMDLSHVRLIVLDEADKLLEESFFSELQLIFGALPTHKQVIAASATYPHGLDEFLVKFMKNPLKVQLDAFMPVLVAIEQFVIDVRKVTGFSSSVKNEESFQNQLKCLKEILKRVRYTQVMIFSAYQLRAEKLYGALKYDDLDVVLLSGALCQQDRLESLMQLQQGKCKIMVATDLAARGIDSENVDLVINFDFPYDISTYIHRIGRAGRFGAPGTAISLLTFQSEWNAIAGFQGKVNLNLRLIESVTDMELITINSQNVKAFSTVKAIKDEETIDTMSWGEMWDYCKHIDAELTAAHYTLQGINIHTEESKICEAVTSLKSLFEKAMQAKQLKDLENKCSEIEEAQENLSD